MLAIVHVFGSCLLNGDPALGIHKVHASDGSGCSKKIPEIGMMHHFMGLFYSKPRYEAAFNNEDSPLVPDEYSVLVRTLGFAVNVTSAFSNRTFEFNRVVGENPSPPLAR